MRFAIADHRALAPDLGFPSSKSGRTNVYEGIRPRRAAGGAMKIFQILRRFGENLLDPLLAAARRLSRYCAWAGGTIFFAVALLITVEVVIRRAFSMSLRGADELSGYGFAIATHFRFRLCVARAHAYPRRYRLSLSPAAVAGAVRLSPLCCCWSSLRLLLRHGWEVVGRHLANERAFQHAASRPADLSAVRLVARPLPHGCRRAAAVAAGGSSTSCWASSPRHAHSSARAGWKRRSPTSLRSSISEPMRGKRASMISDHAVLAVPADGSRGFGRRHAWRCSASSSRRNIPRCR